MHVNYEKDPVKIDITKEDVPPALLMKVSTMFEKYFVNTCLLPG